MARVDISVLALLTGAALVAGCAASPDTPPAGGAECQIVTEAEKSPGYPFDLEKYTNEVLPALVAANCAGAGCHAPPAGSGGFTIWDDAAPGNCNFAKTFNAITPQVDLANPANSGLIISINGGLPSHPYVLSLGDPILESLTSYVADASARYAADGGGTVVPPPGVSPFDYTVFQTVIQPIINTADNKGCAISGCHLTGAGSMTLNANPAPDSPEMQANFIALTGRTNLTTPSSSLIYAQATNRHGGGQSALVSTEQGALILAWIEAAKVAGGGGGGGGVACVPVDVFNGSIFRDEILPILRGQVDLNNAGGNATGCTRGPCHGTDRGPGALFLSDTQDPAAALQNFACFVDLVNPSASEVLICPLDDPRCRRYPHPGDEIFSGADDLNYQKLLSFLYGSSLESTPLDFAFFVRRINPIFNDINAVEDGAQGRTCAEAASCHGVSVAGQAPPNGSNFPIIANATDIGRLTFNFAAASGFTNFLEPGESSLFLYPTNEIANIDAHPFATGLPHPGGPDFAVDSIEALNILRWSGGLRPNAEGFITDWLVGGDYAASRVIDPTPVDEINDTPQIFDSTGTSTFNGGEWDGFFSDENLVDLNLVFPRAQTAGRIAYAVAYLINTTSLNINAQMTITTNDEIRVYVGNQLAAQGDGINATTSAIATLPAYATSQGATRILFKLFQTADDEDFSFQVQLRDDLGNLLTDTSGEIVVLLGAQGGI